MNSRYGAAPTHTPPKPTSRPLTRFSLSVNTVRLSKLAVAVGVFEDQDPVAALALPARGPGTRTPRRPTAGRGRRAPSRSAASRPARRRQTVTVKPSGTVIAFAASSAGKPGVRIVVGRAPRSASAVGDFRLLVVEAEVVEVDVRPSRRCRDRRRG